MSDQLKALRDAANRCTRVNAEVALMCEAALAAVAEVEALRNYGDWNSELRHSNATLEQAVRGLLAKPADADAISFARWALGESNDG